MKFIFKGLGDYATAVAWLDRADAIPMSMPDVREGVKVSHAMCILFVALDVQSETMSGCRAAVTRHKCRGLLLLNADQWSISRPLAGITSDKP